MKHASGGEIHEPDHGDDVPTYLGDPVHCGDDPTPIEQVWRNAFEPIRRSLIPLLPPRKDDDEEQS